MKFCGFTLLEVLIATFIAGLAFTAFLTLAGRTFEVLNVTFDTFVSTVAASNAITEAVERGASFEGESVEILGRQVHISQDFEEFMGFRITKVLAGTIKGENLVEVYRVH